MGTLPWLPHRPQLTPRGLLEQVSVRQQALCGSPPFCEPMAAALPAGLQSQPGSLRGPSSGPSNLPTAFPTLTGQKQGLPRRVGGICSPVVYSKGVCVQSVAPYSVCFCSLRSKKPLKDTFKRP